MVLRLALGIAILVVAGWFGFAHRSPWVILPLGVVFTILYIGGKWHLWRTLWAASGVAGWAKAIAATLPIQVIIAGLFYLIGMGIGRLFGNDTFAPVVTAGDYVVMAVLTLVGVAMSAFFDRYEEGMGPAGREIAEMQEQIDTMIRDAKSDTRPD